MKCVIDNFKNSYYPEGSVTQYFAENYKLYHDYSLQIQPDDPFPLKGHNGIDIVAPWGSPIYCFRTGKIVEVKESETGYGKYVRVLTDALDGISEEWIYAHLSRIDVKLGQRIEKDSVLGLMGNTGFVVSGPTPYWKHNPYAGTHVHIGKRIIKIFKQGDKTWNISYPTGDKSTILNYDNGFKGAVDIAHELNTIEEEIKQVQLTLRSALNNLVVLYQALISKLLGK